MNNYDIILGVMKIAHLFYSFITLLTILITLIYIYGYFDRYFIIVASNILFPILALLCSLTALHLARRYGLKSTLGMLLFMFFAGLFLWFIGELAWTLYVLWLGIEIPFPSIADLFYLAGYIPLFIGLFMYLNIFKTVVSRRAVLYSFTAGLIIVIVTGVYVIPEAFFSSGDMLTASLSTAYPLLDTILIVVALMTLSVFIGGKLQTSWLMISIGFILTGMADLTYHYADLIGALWEGHPLELLYLYAYIYLTIAFYEHGKTL